MPIVDNETYALLTHSVAALVTSGTATLETCLPGRSAGGVLQDARAQAGTLRLQLRPQGEVYLAGQPGGRCRGGQGTFADHFTIYRIINELYRVLPGQPHREEMLQDYRTVADRLGHLIAPDEAARLMVSLLRPAVPAAPVVEDEPSGPSTDSPSSTNPSSSSNSPSATHPPSPSEEMPEEPEEEYELVSVKEFD